MLVLINKNGHLHAKVLMNLRVPIKYHNKTYTKKEEVLLLLPNEVMYILTRNGNIKLWNGKDYIKVNLSQFHDIMQNNDYVIEEYIEPKKEEVKQQEQPKKEVKPEPKKEEVKQQEQPKKEVKQDQNDYKKQRHNNNNKQGGDK